MQMYHVQQVNEYYCSALKYIYNCGAKHGDCVDQCEICGYRTIYIARELSICSRCHNDANDVTAATAQRPQLGHLTELRNRACDAAAAIIQYTQLQLLYSSKGRCCTCLSIDCKDYIAMNNAHVFTLCKRCHADIVHGAGIIRRRNLLVHAYIHDNLHDDVAKCLLAIYVAA